MNLSRQRKYQLRHKAAGLCVACSRLAVNNTHCKIHMMKARLRSRRRTSSKSWKKGGYGRPPLEAQ